MTKNENSPKLKIALMDDEPDFLEAVATDLTQNGFEPRGFTYSNDFLNQLFTFGPELLILDHHMPIKNGLDILKEVKADPRFENLKVMMLTGMDEAEFVYKAYDCGVDDFLTKPFMPDILIRKIRVLANFNRKRHKPDAIEVQGIQLVPAERQAFFNGENLDLTTTEFNILHLMALNNETVVTREQMLMRAFGGVSVTARTVDVHICSLRKKLPNIKIETLRGFGYKIQSPAT